MASKRSDAKQNREHLIGIARSLAKKGEVPSFNVLAKTAKVGVGTVYRHFADQKALLSAMAEDDLFSFREELEAAASLEDPREALEAALKGAVHMVLARPSVATLLASSTKEFRALSAVIENVVTRAQRAKVLRKDLDVNDFRRLVCGIEYAARAGDKPFEAAERYLAVMLAGIRR